MNQKFTYGRIEPWMFEGPKCPKTKTLDPNDPLEALMEKFLRERYPKEYGDPSIPIEVR